MAVVKTAYERLLSRYFTKEGEDVFGKVKWGKRRAYIYDAKEDKALIDQEVEAPDFWSDPAVKIAAYKDFLKRVVPTPEGREVSIRQLADRVVATITQAGEDLGYFEWDESRIFRDELTHLLLHQKGAFNSPVWFNVGLFRQYGIERPSHNFFYNTETGEVEPASGAY